MAVHGASYLACMINALWNWARRTERNLNLILDNIIR